MPAEQSAIDPIELRYTITSEDLVDVVAALARDRQRRSLIAICTVGALFLLVEGAFAVAETLERSPDMTLIVVGIFLVVVLAVVGFGWLANRFTSSLLHRWQARLIWRANPWMSQPVEATVTDQGLQLRNTAMEMRSDWSQYPLYRETDRSFVLLASKRLGATILVLPKRGLDGVDPAQLRHLLDTHCQRWS
jgi:hypothetical protein